MSWLLLLAAAPLLLATAWAVDTSIRLSRNYAAARTIGVLIRLIPISPLNPFWVLLDRRVLPLFRRLPFGDNSFTRYNWRGWEIEDRYRSHLEIGDIWVLVTPFKNWVYINDPDPLMAVFRRGADFPRPVFVSEVLNVFGPNIATAEGQRWKTQRRIATRCFNEQNNEIVWSETINLATDMLRYWTTKTSIRSAAQDLRTLSLHVLSRAGFGKSFKFQGHDDRQASVSPSVNYKEPLQTILENCVLILALGSDFLANSWLPRKLRTVHEAWAYFRTYMTNLYEDEKRAITTDANLMTLLVRASQNEEKTSSGLTEAEIYGNMFAFNFAGHDTTANTFTFALYFLAAHPKVQNWLSAEIRSVLGDRSPQDLDYRTDFPRFKRCLAVLFETMRLYTPVPVIKWTAAQPQTLDSMIAPSYGAVQTDPRYWGPDSLDWKPSRWIVPGEPGDEHLDLHTHGAFIGWSEGARDCPGRKFSQVEFVAMMAVLFAEQRVDPATAEGESIGAARERVLDLIRTDSGPVLLLQMLHPERASLVWRKR
ncbi:Uu.00g075630.m01.CDS01 [Anthostomella pinea]|uniref:Uu.00g075630.m01.CDS01 n=1 Tax=Anthostomella pinea TaxID=933095 RepID=A0AAI8VWX2_9PEZI|nr:Uu.00g075630.m01.CDS01 [Anthostomella pinea]